MSLMKDCLIVNLQIGAWSGHRLDKRMTREVTEKAGAVADAARVNKHLVSKESLAGVVTAIGAIRTHFYSDTLPWKDNGDRLLVRKLTETFVIKHGELEGNFKGAVKEFVDTKYPAERERAEFRMGDLFNPNDYPRAYDIEKKFYVNLDIDAVAEAKDIRLNDNTEIMQRRVTNAVAGLWAKLAEPLQHFATTMSDEKAIFRDSTVKNLKQIVEMIPALNFTNDPNLETIRKEIDERIARYEPSDLRKDKDVRSAIAAEAREIMEQMAPFMNAFGGPSEDGE